MSKTTIINLSNKFSDLQNPVESLATKTGLTTNLGKEAVSLIWDYYTDHAIKNNGNTDFLAAYNECVRHIEGCMAIFDNYAKDYGLSEEDAYECFHAWLLEGDIIEDYNDLTDALMETKIPEMLFQLDSPENRYSTFSAGSTPALTFLFHLRIYETVQSIEEEYRAIGSQNAHNLDPHIDKNYAIRLINDIPPIDTQLIAETKEYAESIANMLRNVRTNPGLALVKKS